MVKIKLMPLLAITALGSGFYIGYMEGKGLDVSTTKEYIAKYGPTTLAMATTSSLLYATYNFSRKLNQKIIQNLRSKDLEIDINGEKRMFKDLSNEEKNNVSTQIINQFNNLESILHDGDILKPTLAIGIKTAAETTVGYVAGRLYSQMG